MEHKHIVPFYGSTVFLAFYENNEFCATDGVESRYDRRMCTRLQGLHKDRNIAALYLPKRYRKQAHHLFAAALEQNSYKDAKKMLQEFERWLRDINESAADSLLEALEEVADAPQVEGPRSTALRACTRRIL